MCHKNKKKHRPQNPVSMLITTCKAVYRNVKTKYENYKESKIVV